MSLSGSTINVDNAANSLSSYVSRGLADDTSNLSNDKVYLYHGTLDSTVTAGILIIDTGFEVIILLKQLFS